MDNLWTLDALWTLKKPKKTEQNKLDKHRVIW